MPIQSHLTPAEERRLLEQDIERMAEYSRRSVDLLTRELPAYYYKPASGTHEQPACDMARAGRIQSMTRSLAESGRSDTMGTPADAASWLNHAVHGCVRAET